MQNILIILEFTKKYSRYNYWQIILLKESNSFFINKTIINLKTMYYG